MSKLSVLLCHPGPNYSVADVHRGIDGALKALGHEVVEYAFDGRMRAAASWQRHSWRRAGRPANVPTMEDACYQASELIITHALRFQVDWVLIIAGMLVHPYALTMARRAGLRVAMLFTESPYEDAAWQIERARLVDACWVNERTSVARFREVQPNTWYWQHAYDPAVHRAERQDAELPAHDVVFVGSGFPERCEMLSAVDWTGIDLGLYGAWPLLGSRSRLRKYLRGGVVSNAMAAELYRRARIGLNMHRTSVRCAREGPRIAYAESMNPRCYELAATGSFFVSDARAELVEVFGPAVPTFETPAELQGLIGEYLLDEGRRRALAEEARRRVAGHTFEARVRELIARLQEA